MWRNFRNWDEAEGWKASLALTVTLLDTNQDELPQRVVFQKNYRAQEPMPEKTPQDWPGDEPGHGAGLGSDHQ